MPTGGGCGCGTCCCCCCVQRPSRYWRSLWPGPASNSLAWAVRKRRWRRRSSSTPRRTWSIATRTTRGWKPRKTWACGFCRSCPRAAKSPSSTRGSARRRRFSPIAGRPRNESRGWRAWPIRSRCPLSIGDAAKLLRQSRLARKEIYVFTDLSRGAWPVEQSTPLRREITAVGACGIYVIDVGLAKAIDYGTWPAAPFGGSALQSRHAGN